MACKPVFAALTQLFCGYPPSSTWAAVVMTDEPEVRLVNKQLIRTTTAPWPHAEPLFLHLSRGPPGACCDRLLRDHRVYAPAEPRGIRLSLIHISEPTRRTPISY